jgi:alpha-amylase/alpha-mannosidase (GH57 family)
MWPAEGAVSQNTVGLYAAAGVRWIATDRGVLRKSGEFGYDADSPDVLCQARRAEEAGKSVAVFFRDTELSDAIGFHYNSCADPAAAAADFIGQLQTHFIPHFQGEAERVVSVILDGENAWGGYTDDGRPFLHALYRQLAEVRLAVRTVTYREWLDGNPARGISAHPVTALEPIFPLFTGSWIDESGSDAGVDLGTWIGEAEENRAWAALGEARRFLAARGATPEHQPAAYDALYAAEGSDWFWWYGTDQESEHDDVFDELFRGHLCRLYRALGAETPLEVQVPWLKQSALWTAEAPRDVVSQRGVLVIRSRHPAQLTWRLDGGGEAQFELLPAGGVMAGVTHYEARLGPFPEGTTQLRFSLRCTGPDCAAAGYPVIRDQLVRIAAL